MIAAAASIAKNTGKNIFMVSFLSPSVDFNGGSLNCQFHSRMKSPMPRSREDGFSGLIFDL
jgi:hypothetical protein